MKKILFILLALPMLWGCKEDSEEVARREWMAKVEKIFAEVMAEAGDYNVALAEEMLADKNWIGNTYAWYNDDWSELKSTGIVDGVYPPPPPGACVTPVIYDFALLADGRKYWGAYLGGEADDTWAFDAENRTLTFANIGDSNLIEIHRVVALSDEWLILENDQHHMRMLFEGRAIVGLDE